MFARSRILVVALFVTLASACAPTLEYTQTATPGRVHPKAAADVQVFMLPPQCPYDELGLVRITNFNQGLDDNLPYLRAEAGRYGADAIVITENYGAVAIAFRGPCAQATPPSPQAVPAPRGAPASSPHGSTAAASQP